MMMKTKIFLRGLIGLLAVGAAVVRGSTVIPATPQSVPVLLRGGSIHPVSGPVLENGDILFVDGRIVEVGRDLAPPARTEFVNIAGKHVYPGLIAACTRLGLAETSSLRATVDIEELGVLNSSVRAAVALNPDSELIPVARSNGVLTALSVPGVSPHLIAGVSALIRLDGWTWEDLAIRPRAALHVYWPSMGIDHNPKAKKKPSEQQEAIDGNIRMLDEAFARARAYAKARSAARGPGPARATDLGLEALAPATRGELPVFVHAEEAKQIIAALAWAKRQDISITLVGGADAWRVADELRASSTGVILLGTNRLPRRRDDPYDSLFALPATLRDAGVRFCIASDPDGPNGFGNERNVSYEAAKAVGYGLKPDEALAAVTLRAAEMLGVGDELGSLEKGKRATLIVTDGDPLQIPTQVEIAYIDGARIDLRNKQTQLYEKYRERLERKTAGEN